MISDAADLGHCIKLLALIVILPVACLAPGCWICCRLLPDRAGAEERAAVSYALSLLIFGCAVLIEQFLPKTISIRWINVSIVVAMAVCAAGNFGKIKQLFGPAFGLWCAFYAAAMSFQLFEPVPAGGSYYADWHAHFYTATQLLNRTYDPGDGVRILFSRTPLFNLISAFGMSCAGGEFVVHQVIVAFLNSLIFLPLYVIARRLIKNPFLLRGCLLFLVVCPVVVQSVWLMWPKQFAAFYLLIALWALLESEGQFDRPRVWLFALSITGAFMAHPYVVIYFPCLLIICLMASRQSRLRLLSKSNAHVFLICLAIPAIWYILGLLNVGVHGLMRYNVAMTDLPEFEGAGDYAMQKTAMLLTTLFIPYGPDLVAGPTLSDTVGQFGINWYLRTYYGTILFCATLTGGLILLWNLRTLIRASTSGAWLFFSGIVLLVVTHPQSSFSGLVATGLLPNALVMSILVFSCLQEFKSARLRTACVGMLFLESIVLRAAHLSFYARHIDAGALEAMRRDSILFLYDHFRVAAQPECAGAAVLACIALYVWFAVRSTGASLSTNQSLRPEANF